MIFMDSDPTAYHICNKSTLCMIIIAFYGLLFTAGLYELYNNSDVILMGLLKISVLIITLNSFLFLILSVKVSENEDFMTKLLEEMSQAQEQLIEEKQIITG